MDDATFAGQARLLNAAEERRLQEKEDRRLAEAMTREELGEANLQKKIPQHEGSKEAFSFEGHVGSYDDQLAAVRAAQDIERDRLLALQVAAADSR